MESRKVGLTRLPGILDNLMEMRYQEGAGVDRKTGVRPCFEPDRLLWEAVPLPLLQK